MEQLEISRLEQYIGLAPRKELSSMVMDKIEAWVDVSKGNGLLRRWRENWNLYYNNAYNYNYSGLWNSLEVGGESGEYIKVRINHFRNIATHILNLIFQKFPQGKAKALHSTASAYDQVELYDAIIKHDREKKGLRSEIRNAAEMALIMDTAGLLVEWDMMAGGPKMVTSKNQLLRYGDANIRAYSPLDWFTDITKMHENDIEWVIVRKYVNRYKLAAQFPDKASKILDSARNDQFKDIAYFSPNDTSDIPIYHFYHVPMYGLRSEEIDLSKGRFAIIVDKDLILYDGANPYGRLPLFIIRSAPRINSFIGYSLLNDLCPIQNLINAIFSSVCTAAIACGTPSIAVPEGSKITPAELASGMNLFEIPPGSQPPQALDLLGTNPQMYQLIQLLISQIELVSGMNSVVRGDPQSTYKSGTMMSIVMTQAVQFVNWFQENIYTQYSNIENHKLELYKRYADSEQLISIVGEDKAAIVRKWTKDNIQQIESVAVENVDPMFSTYTGNVVMAKDLLDAKMLKTPGQYTQCIKTGNVTDLLKSISSQEALVKRENEMISQGKLPMVDYYDDDDYHLSEHRMPVDSPQMRLDPLIYGIYQKHQQLHEQNKLTKIQQQTMLQMAAQGAQQESQQIESPQPQPGQEGGQPPPQQAEPPSPQPQHA